MPYGRVTGVLTKPVGSPPLGYYKSTIRKLIMDNITLIFTDLKIAEQKVRDFLKNEKDARPSFKPDTIMFSRWVGKYKSKWLFDINPKKGTIRCSGGPTTTFFGFNAWVSIKEHAQMEAIVGILLNKLRGIEGVTFPTKIDPLVYRVEITNLYPFASLAEIGEAEIAIYQSLVARYPKRVQIAGASIEVPGTVRVGQSKSTSTLRLYPEASKFDSKPEHVEQDLWNQLNSELKRYMRVESMFDSRQLKTAGLSRASAWKEADCAKALVDRRMTDAGLRGARPQNHAALDKELASKPHLQTKQVINNWKNGKDIPKNGTWSSAQILVKKHGFDLSKPFAHQKQLDHGFSDYFTEVKVYELAKELRLNKALFNRWWEI